MVFYLLKNMDYFRSQYQIKLMTTVSLLIPKFLTKAQARTKSYAERTSPKEKKRKVIILLHHKYTAEAEGKKHQDI
jgi:hypothetical protein